MHKYKLAWDLAASFVFIFAYFLDPIIFGTYYRIYLYKNVQMLQFLTTCILLINAILTPFTGTKKEPSNMVEVDEEETTEPKSGIDTAKAMALKERRGNANSLIK